MSWPPEGPARGRLGPWLAFLPPKKTTPPLRNGRIYRFLVDAFANPPPIRHMRKKIISLAVGEVLEIGAGSGADFPYYDPLTVTRLDPLEPDPGMIALARRRLEGSRLPVSFLSLPAERIPLDDGVVDTVVATFSRRIPGRGAGKHAGNLSPRRNSLACI